MGSTTLPAITTGLATTFISPPPAPMSPPIPPGPPGSVSSFNVNQVDAGIAKVYEDNRMTDPEIEGIPNAPRGSADATIGTRVKKSGRTTEVTNGRIISTNALMSTEWGLPTVTNISGTALTLEYHYAFFRDQLKIAGQNFVQSGDSGAVVLNENNSVVGLVSTYDSRSSYASKIRPILYGFNVSIENG